MPKTSNWSNFPSQVTNFRIFTIYSIWQANTILWRIVQIQLHKSKTICDCNFASSYSTTSFYLRLIKPCTKPDSAAFHNHLRWDPLHDWRHRGCRRPTHCHPPPQRTAPVEYYEMPFSAFPPRHLLFAIVIDPQPKCIENGQNKKPKPHTTCHRIVGCSPHPPPPPP